MARSTLFALLVLALIQVAWALPYGYHQIINDAAKGAIIGYRGRTPNVERGEFGESNNYWGIEEVPGGATIFMPPAGSFLTVVDGGYVLLEEKKYVWAISTAGDGKYIIKNPNSDLVLDWNERSRNVVLKPANGESSQLWHIGTTPSYSRMFHQC
ncbi:hypothetical protein BGZ70_006135 [Mortierella alpina]|uniref:Uncharacterized protein n=1 Tax=Mortierella alpina TaxID=64518 RepID=A0A9P6J821_MORAP|nr:hypothetical protein BGZ70_006135 [Mortierella alpina]